MNRKEHEYIRDGLTKDFINKFNNLKIKHCSKYWYLGGKELYKEAESIFYLRVCEHYHTVVEKIEEGEIIGEPTFAAYIDRSLRTLIRETRRYSGRYNTEESTDALGRRIVLEDTNEGGDDWTIEDQLSVGHNTSFEGGIGYDVEVALSTIENPKTRFAAEKIYLEGWDSTQFYETYKDWLGINRKTFLKNLRLIDIEDREKYYERSRKNSKNYRKTKKLNKQ